MHHKYQLLSVLLCASFASLPSTAQELRGYGIGEVKKHTQSTKVDREYYSRLGVSVVHPNFPPGDKKRKKLLAAFLQAFGGKNNQTHVITVTLKARVGEVLLPEQVLISYKMNSSTGEIDAVVNDGIVFPAVRLDSNDSIRFELFYRDAKSADVDLSSVGKNIAGLVPGSSLLSPLSTPFVSKIGEVSGSIVAAMNTAVSKSAYSNGLSPSGDSNKKIEIELKTPNGTLLGTVLLYLEATPTLARSFVPVFSASEGDYSFRPGEDLSTLATTLAGTKRSYLTELRSRETFLKLIQGKTDLAISEFCKDGRDHLGNQLGLSLMDRSQLLLLALASVGIKDTVSDTAWFYSCFNEAEIVMLGKVRSLAPPPPKSSIASTPIPKAMLYALGCWMRQSEGNDCTSKAPNSEKALQAWFADDVKISIDSGFIDPLLFGETGSLSRQDLIAVLKGSATNFRCFSEGMIVLGKRSDVPFRLLGVVERQRLTALSILPAPHASPSCTE